MYIYAKMALEVLEAISWNIQGLPPHLASTAAEESMDPGKNAFDSIGGQPCDKMQGYCPILDPNMACGGR